ncbi:hypothetical protein D9M72_448490 [compost metagenome]
MHRQQAFIVIEPDVIRIRPHQRTDNFVGRCRTGGRVPHAIRLGDKIVQSEPTAQFRRVRFLLPVGHALPALRRRMLPVTKDQRLLRLDEMAALCRLGLRLVDIECGLLIAFEHPHQQFEFEAAQGIRLVFIALAVALVDEDMQRRDQFDLAPCPVGNAPAPDPAEVMRTAEGRRRHLDAQDHVLPRERPFHTVESAAGGSMHDPDTRVHFA